jgi:hypothetical protein
MNFIKGQATLTLAALADDDIHAIYMASQDEIVLDAQKLCQVVNEKIESALGVNIYLGSFEEVWIVASSLVFYGLFNNLVLEFASLDFPRKKVTRLARSPRYPYVFSERKQGKRKPLLKVNGHDAPFVKSLRRLRSSNRRRLQALSKMQYLPVLNV